MGGSQTRTIVQKQFVQDPAMLEQIRQSREQVDRLVDCILDLKKRLAQAEAQARKLKDPKHFRDQKEKSFSNFIQNISNLKFTQKIPKKNGQQHYVLIGNIASGKSSLINKNCGTKLAVGLGHTTQTVNRVAFDGKIHIWDSPGSNQDFSYYDPQNLAYFHSADRIFILYPDSLRSAKDMIRVLYAIKPSNIYLVRTMCDRWKQGHDKTIQQELETDRSLLKQWKMNIQVLATSAQKDTDFLDNLRLNKLLRGQTIPKIEGVRDFILIGDRYSGKSSLINYVCEKKVSIQVQNSTQYFKKVVSSGRINIWESLKSSKDINFKAPQVLEYFRSADKICIVYSESLKNLKDMIKALFAIKPNSICLVRTMCDKLETGYQTAIQLALRTDRNLLKQWNVNIHVFGTSTLKNLYFLDNLAFKKYLLDL